VTPNTIMLDGRPVGQGQRPYIVAEMSANHNGVLEDALAIIDVAVAAGADAVKIQTYTADSITMDVDRPEFQIHGGLWDGKSLYALYQWAATPYSWHAELFSYAKKRGITLFSAPFDLEAVDFLEDLDCPFYKIASCELVDLPLIAKVAQTGKPMILSTGMASAVDVRDALACARDHGADDLIVLQCVSGYPAPAEDYNLAHIPDIASRFEVLAGLSDHTLDTATAIAATALGACLIEKHVTLGRDRGGPDDSFSLEQSDLEQLVAGTTRAHAALGQATYSVQESEADTRQFRRSLYIAADMKAGDRITETTVKSIRPSLGLAPKHYWEILGKRVRIDLKRGTPLSWDFIDGGDMLR